LSSWTLEPGSPELDIGRSELDLSSGQTTAAFRNWGASTLTLAGVDQVDGLTVEASSLTLEPGEEGTLRFTWTGGDLDQPICLASDDADEPLQQLILLAGDNPSKLGEAAIDFTLPDLDGNEYTLSDHLGQPVVLAYFATW
ncbi:MAG: redoxin domain-containing protein, partial [Proteobacteria bacterium]|nr:redoxin domain-containing protein [Pseudomonadota bacterium]